MVTDWWFGGLKERCFVDLFTLSIIELLTKPLSRLFKLAFYGKSKYVWKTYVFSHYKCTIIIAYLSGSVSILRESKSHWWKKEQNFSRQTNKKIATF